NFSLPKTVGTSTHLNVSCAALRRPSRQGPTTNAVARPDAPGFPALGVGICDACWSLPQLMRLALARKIFRAWKPGFRMSLIPAKRIRVEPETPPSHPSRQRGRGTGSLASTNRRLEYRRGPHLYEQKR